MYAIANGDYRAFQLYTNTDVEIKSLGFGLGLAFLGFIFIPILGFSDAVYTDPNSEVNNYLEENSMNKFN